MAILDALKTTELLYGIRFSFTQYAWYIPCIFSFCNELKNHHSEAISR